MFKYACINGYFTPIKGKVGPWKSSWPLPKLYGVPENECTFVDYISVYEHIPPGLIQLTFRPNGDYETHLKILKAHHLIESSNQICVDNTGHRSRMPFRRVNYD